MDQKKNLSFNFLLCSLGKRNHRHDDLPIKKSESIITFGWYDGRNNPTFTSLDYFGAVITACQLDKLVEKIPLSNPLYSIPASAPPTSQNKSIQKACKGQRVAKMH